MKSETHERVLESIKELTREYGRVYFGIDTVVERCGVPKDKLWDVESYTGIFQDLSDSGHIIVDHGVDPDVCLDSECFC